MTQTEFIKKIAGYAVEDAKTSKILPSLTIAQAILESNWGKSGLTNRANNLFGMKGTYNGEYVEMNTKEWVNGSGYVTMLAKFRKYPSWLESVSDHSGLFNRLDMYANLRGCTDYKLACKYVKEDGYATSPTYTQSLIDLIEKYDLMKYDAMVNGDWNTNIYGGVESQIKKGRCNVVVDMPVLKNGSSGAAVVMWQMIVSTKVDGVFGNKTIEATKRFQKNKNLVVDGVVGSNSWNVALSSL